MEESKKWRDFLCILKFSKTGNHSVNANIRSKSIHLTVNCMKFRLESFFFIICLQIPTKNLAFGILSVLADILG